MYDQMFDAFRRATETGLQVQQDWLRQWTSALSGPAFSQNAWAQQRQKLTKEACGAVTDLMNKHRGLVDSQYQASIKAIEDAFKVGEARDAVELKQKAEEFYRRSFDTLKGLMDNQLQQSQAAMERCMDFAGKCVP